MKRLVGGDFLLDVSSIELEETSTLTNITDTDVISQLTNLKKFIPNPSMIKPIWVKLHDGNDKLVVARGTLCVIDADEFELDVILNGYTLKIHIKFTQVLNENDDPIDDWYIATNDAKYLFTTNNFATFKVANVKNIDGEILSQLKCGDVVIKEDTSGEHAYIVSYRGETGICLTYTDAYCVETQSYDLVDDNWVYNSEDKTIIAEPQMENIVDADGHKRFVEGNGAPLQQEGVNISYCKWSLSGTHLMFVLAGSITNTTEIQQYASLAQYQLPKWIMDKIYPVWNDTFIEKATILLIGEDWSEQSIAVVSSVDKTYNMFYITAVSSLTLTANRSFRIEFDLLIDNE